MGASSYQICIDLKEQLLMATLGIYIEKGKFMAASLAHRQASILKWGNSQGVRLTSDMLRQAQLQVADPVHIFHEKGRIVIEAVKPKVRLEQLLDQMQDSGGIDLVDYGPSVGRELP